MLFGILYLFNRKVQTTQVFYLILLLLFCIPLLFINIKNNHDWGDDFASYIHQAKNICEGIPQSQNGYVLNQDYPKMGPPAYPIGFPLLLSPVFYFCGNSIHAFTLFFSALLILSALLMYRFFKFHFSAITSIFLILIIVYNPWVLNFKMEVMSEIPFTFFLLSIVILYQFNKEEKNYFYYFFIGLLSGFLMSIRAAGSVFVMAVGIELAIVFFNFWRKKITIDALKKSAIQKFLLIFTAIFIYLLLSVCLFRIPSSGFLYYTSVLTFDTFAQQVGDNLVYNLENFRNFFATENKDWQFLPLFTQSAILTCAVLGFVKKVFHKFDFVDLVVLLYCLLLLVWPYNHSSFRFLLPIAAILLYYAVIAAKDIKINFIFIKRKYLFILLGLLILIQYKVGTESIIKHQKVILWGLQEASAADAFDYIKNNIPQNALIDFVKPRALALYAERESCHIEIHQSMLDIKENINIANISYLLYTDEPINFYPEDSLKKYRSLKDNNLVPDWSNSKFNLYRVIK